MRSVLERFYEKVDRNGPIPAHRPELGQCHTWNARRDIKGYGHFRIGPSDHRAHRVAFFLAHGRWPVPCCLHSCDNRACVNPAHLIEGTQTENIADMDAKGRRRSASGDLNGSITKPESVLRGELNGRARLTEQQVRDIRANYALCRVKQVELAERFGIAQTLVSQIVRRKVWKCVA